MITFTARLHRPAGSEDEGWLFLLVPPEASQALPSRSMVSVEGTFEGVRFATTLSPDGEGGHWMKVKSELARQAAVNSGDTVEVLMEPATEEPEPDVPDDVLDSLGQNPAALETWKDITPKARRDWIAWIVSGKKAETRVKRISVALSKLEAGDRRPCCFDRSGMFDKSLRAPRASAQ